MDDLPGAQAACNAPNLEPSALTDWHVARISNYRTKARSGTQSASDAGTARLVRQSRRGAAWSRRLPAANASVGRQL